MSNYAFVLDTNRRPLAPCHPARARELLSKGKASVFRRYPFIIILNHAPRESIKQDARIQIDPGSKTTGNFTIGDTVTHHRHLEKLFCSDGYRNKTTQLAKVILTTDTRIKKMYRSLIKTSYRMVTKELKKKVTLYTLQTNLNTHR